ncbi:MAG: protein kinase domain-containing protein, partial [Anaeromyxobacteraceae bacterium]
LIRRIDRYELLEQVGSGGMAVVYRGRDTALDREVAIKLLHPHLASRSESRARFSREARAVARLSHPNIVEIYDYAGDAAVESYLVTEFVPGRTLRAFVEGEGVRFPEAGALLARALADALVHAHAAGVIHRDLKPENVLLLEAGGRRAVKLVDFGIARIIASDEKMTMTGALVGSPNHMAPEIIEGREADARSDLFSLGTILFWLCTGELPFAAPNPTATLRRVIEGEHADPREVSPLVSDALAAVIARALEPDPDRRTPTAAALRDELDRALGEAGLEDPPAELRAYLADPHAYEALLAPRLVAAALARADAALAAGETARAMRHMNRVLALDPDNAEVSERLACIERRARWKGRVRRGAAVMAAAALLGVAAWGGAGWFEHGRAGGEVARPSTPLRSAQGDPSTPVRTAQGDPSTPVGSGQGEPSTPVGSAQRDSTNPLRSAQGDPSTPLRYAPGERGGSVRAERSAERGVEAPPTPLARTPVLIAPGVPTVPAAPAEVTAFVRPYAQRALLDDVEVARGEQRVRFTLTAGAPHRIQIEHACCFPFVRDFAAGEALPAALELKVPLAPRPARLRVDADAETRVLVDGRLAGTAEGSQRDGIDVAVPATGPTPYEGEVELRLERDGFVPVRTTVRVRAGAEVTFAAPPPQRVPIVAPPAEQRSSPSAVAPPTDEPPAEGRP